MTGRIIFLSSITRDMLRAAPDARFVFGDNVARKGMGGQAREMRGEPNAIGVATKWRPTMEDEAFFKDDDPGAEMALSADLSRIVGEWSEGRLIYIPKAGLGTGLSQLPVRAPKLNRYLIDRLTALLPAGETLPWSA